MNRFGSVVFGAALLSPLFAGGDSGGDGVRLPALLALSALLLGHLALTAYRRRERLLARAPLLTAGLLLLAVQAASLLVALNPWEGAATILVLGAGIAVYAYARSGLLPRGFVRGQGVWVLAAAILVFAAVGIAQRLSGSAPVSTEGNTNYSGTLAAMMLPPAAAFALLGVPGWKRALAGAAALAALVLLFLTESRGGLVGAAAGLLLMAGALWKKRARSGAAAAAGLLLVLVAVPLTVQWKKHSSFERGLTASVRTEFWRGGWAILAERPWLGGGAGNFALRYPPHRTWREAKASFDLKGGKHTEVEDAHSSWVQTAADSGVPGFVALLLLTYVAARLWNYYATRAPDPDSTALAAGLGGGAAAFLVSGLFNSLTLHASHTVLFWAYLGLMELHGHPAVEGRRRAAGKGAGAVALAAALAALLGCGLAVRMAQAERAYSAAMRTRVPLDRVRLLEEAIGAHHPHWRAHFALGAALQATGNLALAVTVYQESLVYHPNHALAMNGLAVALQKSGKEGEAESWLARADAQAPHCSQTGINRGALAYLKGDLAGSREHLGRALRIDPKNALAHFILGETFLKSGDLHAAVPQLRRARELGLDVAGTLRSEHPKLAGDPLLAEFFR